jgi:hypothetical protein
MCPAIYNPASCEIRPIICFIHTKIMSAGEIHCELCKVYGQNAMSEETVRKWCAMFKNGPTNIYGEERGGRPAICSG